MAGIVAILEDSAGRIAEMRACLTEALPGCGSIFFDNAFEMMAWLKEHMGEVALISLDHDLPLTDAQGKLIDCGDGRMVADFLATLPPTCPVIVHSSNAWCAPGMYFALEGNGWPTARVVPYEDDRWVREAWKPLLVKWVAEGWIKA